MKIHIDWENICDYGIKEQLCDLGLTLSEKDYDDFEIAVDAIYCLVYVGLITSEQCKKLENKLEKEIMRRVKENKNT